MEKQKSWQLYLIIAVIALTLYNILPTIFYYTKPLKEPIDAPRAEAVAEQIVKRVNSLEKESQTWLSSFCKLLGIKPASIELKPDEPGLVEVTFHNEEDAKVFQRFLPRAGALIPFVPAQLGVFPNGDDPKTVLVTRHINTHLNPNDIDKLFHFSPKHNENGEIASFYRDVIYDRVGQLGLGFAGTSRTALQLAAVTEKASDPQYDDLTISLAREIVDVNETFKDSPIAKRYYASFSQINSPNREELIQKFASRVDGLKAKLEKEKAALDKEEKDAGEEQLGMVLANQIENLGKASTFVKGNLAAFRAGHLPLTAEGIQEELVKSAKDVDPKDQRQTLNFDGRNPWVEALVIDWGNDDIEIKFYEDVRAIRDVSGKTEERVYTKDRLNHFVISEISRVSQLSDEEISPTVDGFNIALNQLTNMQSFLAFELRGLAQKQVDQVLNQLVNSWTPEHVDLAGGRYPIIRYESYRNLKPEEQKLGLVVYAPLMYSETPPEGLKSDSIYVIARGLHTIAEKYRTLPDSPEQDQLAKDIENLNNLLRKEGFIGYSGASFGIDPQFKDDLIFELDDYYSPLLSATREDFVVKGSKRYAVLDFTNVEQRIITLNKIEDRIQEDLLKWEEEYNSTQVDIDVTRKYDVPAPTKNPYWENLKLSAVKYFRGDDRKILKWGLDLSGGKTVRIGLRDQNNRVVTNPDDINQAVNELYKRVNAMGVAERTIHVENNNIILDFPGSQELSAADLIKASAMYFHIVNEKFSLQNPSLRRTVNDFLQSVWNEAVVTNRKDIESINEIAWKQLGGGVGSGQEVRARSDEAQVLYENGLRLADPLSNSVSSVFNDTLSSIAIMRGSDFSEWGGQSHPLMIVFHNYALEGSNLKDVQVGYDPKQGNILSFGVKSSYTGSQTGSPRDDFYAWTSQFAKDRIEGTSKAVYSNNQGWRMAVILNNTVVSQPTLRQALRDSGMISGRFSQREINQLAADLKAGSLSFKPRILSEQNVSPELGMEERARGIWASTIALCLVFAAMIAYYRFAGIVASCAVLMNILIMWGVLQNLGAAITLPGIAGIVLTIGMAVDANVLVFERIREEFKISGRLASAIQAGYQKAFSAIVDSNITTIIAALILIQFDSGPIKGFAVTLIIGIVSSMFTALFMTRYFFAGWVRKPKNTTLGMMSLTSETHFNFLGQTRKAFAVSFIVMVLGTYLFVEQRNTIFGMDFTGGYSITVDLEETADVGSYRLAAEEALEKQGATPNDFLIKELSKPNHLRIQLGMGMEESGHPFYQLPENYTEGTVNYDYERNPRIMWVVNALSDSGLNIQQSELPNLDKDWTVMSGQFSDTMRNNAILALGAALISILIYITLRFEFNFAIGAVVGLAHDVIITLGIFALFHRLGFAVQIDLQVIGAIMTIIGYSLNDTIVIFDRVREDMHTMRKMKFRDIINHSLNVTLGRTLMTSGTTLLVLFALVLLGGQAIFAFSLVMTIGVMIGTLSSLFIAGPVMLFFHNREQAQKVVALHKA